MLSTLVLLALLCISTLVYGQEPIVGDNYIITIGEDNMAPVDDLEEVWVTVFWITDPAPEDSVRDNCEQIDPGVYWGWVDGEMNPADITRWYVEIEDVGIFASTPATIDPTPDQDATWAEMEIKVEDNRP